MLTLHLLRSSSRSTNHYDVNLYTCNTPGMYSAVKVKQPFRALILCLCLYAETVCSKDEYGGVCVLNASARARSGKRKRAALPEAMSDEDVKFAKAARAVTLPGDEELDL